LRLPISVALEIARQIADALARRMKKASFIAIAPLPKALTAYPGAPHNPFTCDMSLACLFRVCLRRNEVAISF
jgi:hypothetical protein